MMVMILILNMILSIHDENDDEKALVSGMAGIHGRDDDDPDPNHI